MPCASLVPSLLPDDLVRVANAFRATKNQPQLYSLHDRHSLACQVLHANNPHSCVRGHLEQIPSVLKTALKTYLPVYLIPLLVFRARGLARAKDRRAAITAALKSLLLNIARSSLFFGTMTVGAYAAACAVRGVITALARGVAPAPARALAQPPNAHAAAAAAAAVASSLGAAPRLWLSSRLHALSFHHLTMPLSVGLSALAAVLFEKKERRIELALFSASHCLKAMCFARWGATPAGARAAAATFAAARAASASSPAVAAATAAASAAVKAGRGFVRTPLSAVPWLPRTPRLFPELLFAISSGVMLTAYLTWPVLLLRPSYFALLRFLFGSGGRRLEFPSAPPAVDNPKMAVYEQVSDSNKNDNNPDASVGAATANSNSAESAGVVDGGSNSKVSSSEYDVYDSDSSDNGDGSRRRRKSGKSGRSRRRGREGKDSASGAGPGQIGRAHV